MGDTVVMANSGNDNGRRSLSLTDATGRAGVTSSTLRRWASEGLIPQFHVEWTAAAVSHGRTHIFLARQKEGE